MSPEFVVGFAREAIETALMISLPLLGVGLVVGVTISILQAATQIQEMTLTFVPKILAIFITLMITFPWLMEKMLSFTRELILNIPNYIN
ncbi:MAG: flagellar biosynthesis protein FliQ [Desulfohalobiaceae bacterium]